CEVERLVVARIARIGVDDVGPNRAAALWTRAVRPRARRLTGRTPSGIAVVGGRHEVQDRDGCQERLALCLRGRDRVPGRLGVFAGEVAVACNSLPEAIIVAIVGVVVGPVIGRAGVAALADETPLR